MRAFGVNLPDWFVTKLKQRECLNAYPATVDDVLAILLEDYILRNTPAPSKEETRKFWDTDAGQYGHGNGD